MAVLHRLRRTQGRAVFTAGLGLAAAYISDHLRVWGVKPAWRSLASYLQTVRVLGVKSTSHSTRDRAGRQRQPHVRRRRGIVFPRNAGGKRRLTVDRVEFAGYGLDLPAARHADFAGKDMAGAAVVWLGADGRRRSTARNIACCCSSAADTPSSTRMRPRASVPKRRRPGGGGGSAARGGPGSAGRRPWRRRRARLHDRRAARQAAAADVRAKDAFFEFLFSRAPVKYDELKRKAEAREPLPSFRLDGVTLTFNVDADYEVVRTQLTQNVVGIVEGSDPQLKTTYVAFGAHYDHVGYADGEVDDRRQRRAARARRAA